jgi:hypothetical protein
MLSRLLSRLWNFRTIVLKLGGAGIIRRPGNQRQGHGQTRREQCTPRQN